MARVELAQTCLVSGGVMARVELAQTRPVSGGVMASVELARTIRLSGGVTVGAEFAQAVRPSRSRLRAEPGGGNPWGAGRKPRKQITGGWVGVPRQAIRCHAVVGGP
ncbi:hypothetical protein GCM10009556_010120 [Acrocarpospora pleiomorpha]